MNRRLFIPLIILAVMLSLSSMPPASVGAATSVFINEIHYDNSGTDTGEAVEIAGPADTDLAGWSLVLYNGSNGSEYGTTALSGTIPDQDNGFGTVAVTYPTNGIQNGAPDGLALVDPSSTVVQFLSYEGSFTAVGGPADGMTSTDIGVNEGSSTAVGDSLQLTGSGTIYEDFTWTSPQPNTFGAINVGQTFGSDGQPTPDVAISEVRIDQPGTDNDEYFELAGEAGVSLDGLTYLVIGDGSGGSGVIENVTDLSGYTIDGSGFFVAAESTFSLGSASLTTDLNFENSDNVTHLLVAGFSGSDGDDLDTNDDGTLDATPWAEVLDRIALVEEANPPSGTEYHYGPPSVGPDGSFVPAHAFVCPDGWHIGAFDPAGGDDTPGAANPCEAPPPPVEMCGDAFTPIYDIQGSGLTSPLDGSVVSTEGVVVGDFQDNDGDIFDTDLGGFFIQDSAGDGDPATSDGIFVFAPDALDLQMGDSVRVAGEADEFFGLTQLTNVTTVLLCSNDNTVAPTPVSLPVTSRDDLEAYEGMLVTFPQDLYISEYFNFDRFGEIVFTTDRQFQPTAVHEPGSPEAAQLAQENALSRITLDDGRGNQNPDPARHPNGNVFDLDNRFRGGDRVQNLTGVLSYGFGLYRIQPTQGADYTSENPRPAEPDDVGGTHTVAAFNVLNYFLTIDDGEDICGPNQDQECRGADTLEEFERQRAKILSALADIDADVYGLIEMENTTGVKPLEDIVAGLNAELGAGTYDFIDTGTIGPDAIKVGIIYKPGTVSPVGDYAVLDSDDFLDPNNLDDPKNRPALAQSFVDDTTGGTFTVVVNHLKSKGSPCGEGDDDPQQGNCNLTRTLAAEMLVDWLATDPTGSGDDSVLIIGDLNAYDKEDPIDAIREGADDVLSTGDDYSELLFQNLGEFAYTYVFDGQLGYLDYALAHQELAPDVTGVTVWHINTDEPDILDYDTTFKQDAQDALYEPNPYRSSDHDPVIVGLCVDETAPTVDVSVSPDTLWPANHKYVTVEATVTASDNVDPNPTVTLVSVTSNEPDNGEGDGNTDNDIVIVDDDTFQLRAERSGQGDGRIYTITYEVTDACGNSTVASAEVVVPHNR